MNTADAVIIEAADLLSAGAVARAVDIITQEAKVGNAEALHQLALWHVYGHPLPRNFKAARNLFALAGEAGLAEATRTHAVFVAVGAGGTVDWQQAVGLLAAAADTDPVAKKQICLIDAMQLDDLGRPKLVPSASTSSHPHKISLFADLFTPAECAHVIELATPLLTPSVVVDPSSGRQVPHPIRTSHGAVLGPLQQDLVIHALNQRIGAATATRVEQGEPPVILRYTPGQQYRLHHDCLPRELNQRKRTVITYLNSDYEGGETQFPALAQNVRGACGTALSFANTATDGSVDEMCRHAGLPVERGVKWICTRWIRVNDFDPWGMRNY